MSPGEPRLPEPVHDAMVEANQKLSETIDDSFDKREKQREKDGTLEYWETPDGHIKLRFQLGPVREFGVNGCQVEDVLGILISRLEGFQKGEFACQENNEALQDLKRALEWLESRTKDRENRGVEGKNEK